MIDRSETADSRLPQLPNDPIENAESAEPIDPIESTEPTLPMDSTEPFEAMLRIESLDRIDQRDSFASGNASASPDIIRRPGSHASTATTAAEAEAVNGATEHDCGVTVPF